MSERESSVPGVARFDLGSADEQKWTGAGWTLVLLAGYCALPGTSRHPDLLPTEWKLAVAGTLLVLGLWRRASFEDQVDLDAGALEFRCVRVRPLPERVLETIPFDAIAELAQARTMPGKNHSGGELTTGVVLLTNQGATLNLPCASLDESAELTRKLGTLLGRDARTESDLLTGSATQENGSWRFVQRPTYQKAQRSFTASGLIIIVCTLVAAVVFFFWVTQGTA